VGHGGFWQGFSAYLLRYPHRRLTIAVLANLGTADLQRIATGVAGLHDRTVRPRALLEERKDPDPDTTARVLRALESPAPPNITPELARAWSLQPVLRRGPTERLKELRRPLRLAFLTVDRAPGIERYGVPVATVRHYRLHPAEGATRDVSVYLTGDGRIADLEVSAG
jgi:hypothetical protein